MYEAAIFDFGGVVTTPVGDAFAALDRALGLDEGTVLRTFREQRDEEPEFHRLEKGVMTEREYYDALRRRLEDMTGRELAWPDDASAVRRALFSGMRRNEEMLDAAGRISRHYPVGMLTNNVREWGAWRDHYPMEIFHVVVDSCEVGLRKPEPEIYRLTCERLGVSPDRSVFVDDLEANVDGARAVGMHGILFTDTGSVVAQLRDLFPRAFT